MKLWLDLLYKLGSFRNQFFVVLLSYFGLCQARLSQQPSQLSNTFQILLHFLKSLLLGFSPCLEKILDRLGFLQKNFTRLACLFGA